VLTPSTFSILPGANSMVNLIAAIYVHDVRTMSLTLMNIYFSVQ